MERGKRNLMPDHLQTLREREAYLKLRAEAKQKLGWEWSYDERERAALAWAIAAIEQIEAEKPA